jgi:undecaprenyl diphosphate synthase
MEIIRRGVVLINLNDLALPGTPERDLLERVDMSKLPRHIAVIMDGNGRWAKSRGLPRIEGHRTAVASVSEILEVCARLGIEVLTLYAFSVENWKRPRAEVHALMRLLIEYIRKELHTLHSHNIRLRVIGRLQDLNPTVQKEISRAVELTRNNTGTLLNVALNYGGRTEMVDAVKRIAGAVLERQLKIEEIDETVIGNHLYTSGLPDPDLMIRTSGEMRISNFLLWQLAYSELWMTPTLWPDFRRLDLFQALIDYQKRERRFGDVVAVK